MFRRIILLIFLSWMLMPGFAFPEEYHILPGCVHINSETGKGKYLIEEIVGLAKDRGIKVIIFGDKLTSRVEYGLWPLRNVLKVFHDGPSVMRYGLRRYLERFESFRDDAPEIIVIPGVEVAPFYYWTGVPLRKDFTLHDISKHMFITGFDKPSDYAGLPVITNRNSVSHDLSSLILAWPLLLLALGIYLVFLKPFLPKIRRAGFICLFIGVLLSFNNFPFKKDSFNPYSVENRMGYYQRLIDYVNAKGGAIFWLQPTGESKGEYKGVKYKTLPFPQDLAMAKDYTGFSVFYEGEELARPQGLWDKLLLEYCAGNRNKPVWVFGDMDYSGQRDEGKNFGEIQTVFFAKDKTPQAVLEAMKRGRMYAYYFSNPLNQLRLEKFEVRDTLSVSSGTMGDEVNCFSIPRITIDLSSPYPAAKKLILKLIRDGIVIQTFAVESFPFHINYLDEHFKGGTKSYYRIEVDGIIANPIFVKFSNI